MIKVENLSTKLLFLFLLLVLLGGGLLYQNKTDPCPTNTLHSTLSTSQLDLLNATFQNKIEILNTSFRNQLLDALSVSFKQLDKLNVPSPQNQPDVTVPSRNQNDILNTFEENKKVNAFQCFNYNELISTRKQKEKDYVDGVEKYKTWDMTDMVALPDKQFYVLQQRWTPLWTCETRQRLGIQGDGGKQICNLPYIANNPCIVYSFGLNTETSFEKELKELAPHCQIYGFDPTVGDFYIKNNITYLAFQGIGLSDKDEGAYKSLKTIMSELNHTHIDILKIDIEGGEWKFFPDFFDATFPVCQMSMEIHAQSVQVTMETIEKMRTKKGLKLHYKEPNYLWYPNLIELAWINEALYFETEPL